MDTCFLLKNYKSGPKHSDVNGECQPDRSVFTQLNPGDVKAGLD
jgi:hypothetical protein